MSKIIKVGSDLLETLTVALYENPIIIFREYVQNSLDAYNKAMDEGKNPISNFHVSIDIDEDNKKIVIKDTGYGIEPDKLFQDKMSSIGRSGKDKDRTKYIGFRGIGRISGLPFCKNVIFRNKAQNSDKINICTWKGETYRKLLNKSQKTYDFQSIIKKIIDLNDIDIKNKTTKEHYFEVTLDEYGPEIEAMLKDRKFKEKLIRMLPLKYNKNFNEAKKIISKYNNFMNEPIERFMIPVKYNGANLFKSYSQKNVLDSKIVFWKIKGPRKMSGAGGDKIGLLWFTFGRHLKNNITDEYYGILTRSKNILMGGNETFAQIADNSGAYITTFREMAQALRGVYGELLINSQYLKDNSRRDWFLPDEDLRHLNNVVADFVRRLHNYRYCSSRYFRSNATRNKEDLHQAIDELVNLENNEIDLNYFYKKEGEEPDDKDDKYPYSEQDIPYETRTMKKYYNIIMTIIKKFFTKEKKVELFLKLRAFLANNYKQK